MKAKRVILTYNGYCNLCVAIANEILSISDRKIEVINMWSEEALSWNEKIYGNQTPSKPVLFSIEDGQLTASTGAGLVRDVFFLLGPTRSLKALDLIGQLSSSPSKNLLDRRRKFLGHLLQGSLFALTLGFGKNTSQAIEVNPEKNLYSQAVKDDDELEDGDGLVAASAQQLNMMTERSNTNKKWQRLQGNLMEKGFIKDGELTCWELRKRNDLKRITLFQPYKNTNTGHTKILQIVVFSARKNKKEREIVFP
jgi:predicted DCC family thiol-disulfide oxidoreductase YuxK